MVNRVAQVERIFQEIEDMCFVKTKAGMKSVMRAELTVVEAILQVISCVVVVIIFLRSLFVLFQVSCFLSAGLYNCAAGCVFLFGFCFLFLM